MDLQTRRVHVLKSTENIDGQGYCFSNTPMWSPNGKWILFSCEDGGFITDVRGTSLRDLKLGTDQEGNAYPVSWVGNSCVLYLLSHSNGSSLVHDSNEVLLFKLQTSQSQNPASLMALPSWSDTGLREASDSAFILESPAGKTIETNGKEWTFPATRQVFSGYYSWRSPAAHILGGWTPSSIPAECK
jgi:Tol biopolymer transport system component